MQKRRNYNSEFKSKVTLSYLKGDMTLSELCSHYKLSVSENLSASIQRKIG